MSTISDKNTALITGASSGIGREFALSLAENSNLDLLLVARRVSRLEELKKEILQLRSQRNLAPVEVRVLSCDLRERSERCSLVEDVRALGIRLELLINNAGFGSLGPFSFSEETWEQDMLRVNCEAPVHFCRAFLPDLMAGSRGAIINVCSTAAFQPMPQMATYAATKAFLLSFSQAIAEELSGTGVRVLAHCPGPTDSEFHQVVGLPQKMSFIPGMSTREVVEQALAASQNGRRVYINGWGNALLSVITRVLPTRLSSKGIYHLLQRMKADKG